MKKLAGFLTVLGFIVLGVYAYHGGFSDLAVKEEVSGPYYFIYKNHTGAYRETGKMYQELDTYFSEKKIKILAMAGMYFDNPSVVEDGKLRSAIGAIVAKDVYDSYIPADGMQKRIVPSRLHIYAEFPFTNYVSMVIGIKKAYPVLGEYTKTHNFPEYKYKEKDYEDQYSMELYYTDDKIRFLMPRP